MTKRYGIPIRCGMAYPYVAVWHPHTPRYGTPIRYGIDTLYSSLYS
ncbi:hypothetical protein Barb4_03384 [Bacteroidales bacterium Barb4]|nr:hypothetical protein Barb4_03384 [Bacteroidales bacterium Barb4]